MYTKVPPLTLIKKTFLLCCFICLTACAAKEAPLAPTGPMSSPSEEEANTLWEKFTQKQNEQTLSPMSVNGNLRFGLKEESHRVQFILWSNGNFPVRLDLQASIGASVAKIKQEKEEILLYFPQEKQVITAPNTEILNDILSTSFNVPISLLDTFYLINHRYDLVFQDIELQETDLTKGRGPEEKYSYTFKDSKYFGVINLNANAKPVFIELNDLWQMHFSYRSNGSVQKIEIQSLENTYELTLFIKEVLDSKPYTPEQLNFEIPWDDVEKIYDAKSTD